MPVSRLCWHSDRNRAEINSQKQPCTAELWTNVGGLSVAVLTYARQCRRSEKEAGCVEGGGLCPVNVTPADNAISECPHCAFICEDAFIGTRFVAPLLT